jgi:hypothetical protein
MDIKELKNLLKNSTSVLILENGEPEFVVVDYAAYKNLLMGTKVADNPARMIPVGEAMAAKEAAMLERLNSEILALKQQIEAEEKEVLEVM